MARISTKTVTAGERTSADRERVHHVTSGLRADADARERGGLTGMGLTGMSATRVFPQGSIAALEMTLGF